MRLPILFLAAIAAVLASCGGGGGSTTILPPDVASSLTTESNCAPGTSTVQANGRSVCTLNLDVTLDPPQDTFFEVAITVSGPVGYLFYESDDTGVEPVSAGKNPRVYTLSFNGATGAGRLPIYVRSTLEGTGTVSVSSSDAVSLARDVEFTVDTTQPDAIRITAEDFANVTPGTDGTMVTVEVLNALGNVIVPADCVPDSACTFDLFLTSDDADGLFSATGTFSPKLRSLQVSTDSSGQAILWFGSDDSSAHDVTLNAAILDVTGVADGRHTIQIFSSKTGISKVTFSATCSTPGSGVTDCATATANGVTGFFSDDTTRANIVQVTVDVLSIHEVMNGGDCNCGSGDANACSDPGEIACPAVNEVEFKCPTGLGNPSQSQCKFSASGGPFTPVTDSCRDATPTGSCVRVNCDGNSACRRTFLWRIESGSVARQTGFADTPVHPIQPRILRKVNPTTWTAFSDPEIERTDTQPMLNPRSVLFLADPTYPERVEFTKPECSDDNMNSTCDAGTETTDGGANHNCSVTTLDGDADITMIQCSSDPNQYELALSDPDRPSIPVDFDLKNSLDAVSNNFNITLSTNGPIPDAMTPSYAMTYDFSGTPTTATIDGSGDFSIMGEPASSFSNIRIYPPLSEEMYSIDVSVLADQSGFPLRTKTLMFNPRCNSPVSMTCRVRSADSFTPAAAVPANCTQDTSMIEANGADLVYTECEVKSFAQSLGDPTQFGCTGNERVDSTKYAVQLTGGTLDGDNEFENFCGAASGCNAPADFNINGQTSLPLQLLTTPAPQTVARFCTRVDSSKLDASTFAVDFDARLQGFDGGSPFDLSPADLVTTSKSFTVARDTNLPGDVRIEFVELGTGNPATSIYSRHAINNADFASELSLSADAGEAAPFAARVQATITDFAGVDYSVPTGSGHPLCRVRLSAGGAATGTQFLSFNSGTQQCEGTPASTIELLQADGSTPLVEACVISEGSSSAAVANAAITGELINVECDSPEGTQTESLPVNSVIQGVKFVYNLVNTTGADVPITGIQARTALDTSVFCEDPNTTSSPDPNCEITAQPFAFTPGAAFAGKTASATYTEQFGTPEINALVFDPAPFGCQNAFTVPGSGQLEAWTVTVSVAPDVGGVTLQDKLTNRLGFSTGDAAALYNTAAITAEEVNQLQGCIPTPITSIDFQIVTGDPVYYGAP